MIDDEEEEGLRTPLTPLNRSRLQRARTWTGQNQKWTVKASIAFWVSILKAIGSWLFLIGSIGCYPNASPTEALAKMWIDIPFLEGAVIFGIANYLLYFQMINKFAFFDDDFSECPKDQKVRFIAWPEATFRHVGTLMNMSGALCFAFTCSAPFWRSLESNLNGDVFDMLPGAIGSTIFMIGSICEGEYNGWRRCNKETLKSLPVWQAYISFFGAAMFWVGYVAGWNHKAYTTDPKDVTIWAVASPWVVGSLAFLIAGHIDLSMWKKKIYGLGFVTEVSDISSDEANDVDLKQQAMIIVYALLIVSSLVDWGFHIEIPEIHNTGYLATSRDLQTFFTYMVLLVLASVLHRTPQVQPYSSLLWLMRGIAMGDFLCHVLYWKQMLTNDLVPFYAQVPGAVSLGGVQLL